MPEPTCLSNVRARLGEGPVWHEGERAIYWVDIEGRAVHRHSLEHDRSETFRAPSRIGCLVRRRNGGWIAGLENGFFAVDLERDSWQPIARPWPDRPEDRCNDGKCDRAGRFWAGTMHTAMQRATGVLYRLDPDRGVHAMDTGYGITNGPAWSPDERVLYHNDSKARTVYAFDFDASDGTITGKRPFVVLPEEQGFPDGLTVDAEGGIWLAHWGGSRVTRYLPDGRVDRVLAMPVQQVTSCTFGGPDLRTLFITTASIGLTDAELEAQPLAGRLFTVDVDVCGLPANSFAG